tara:strand:- start:529 stop:780 length:252 start_codon:yes stop_codon:yes gene_type:complete
MKNKLRNLLKEFMLEELRRSDYGDGEIILEYLSSDDPPKYIIYYEEEDKVPEIVCELNSDFFDGGMADTIFDFLETRSGIHGV